VTAGSLLGLLALNLLFLVAGVALLWTARGWSGWLELGRLSGVAYLSGVALLCSAWTLLLVAGVPLSVGLMLGTAAAAVAGCGLLGARLGRTLPSLGRPSPVPITAVAAVGVAAAGVALEALFRAARLSGLYAFDAWAFWVPKAKAIYFYGGLDEQIFTTLPGPSYPPLLPTLEAAAFHFMGSADVVTLHLQLWALAAGFVAAVAGLLADRVPAWILWPFLVLLLVLPRTSEYLTAPLADFLLDELFVLAALLVAVWLLDGGGWRLVLAGTLLSAAVLTKREGMLLAACLLVAALAVSARRHERWRPLLATGAAVALVAVPWRIWYAVEGLPGEAPPGGGLDPTEHGERIWPSIRLAVETLFDGGLWSVVTPLAVVSIVLALLARSVVPAAYVATMLVLATLGGAWLTWAFPDLPITAEESLNPIVRYTGAAVLLGATASPLLLAAAWQAARGRAPGSVPAVTGPYRRTTRLALALALAVLVVYPGALLAVGGAGFPDRDDCARAAVPGQPVDVVFGRFDDPTAAEALYARVIGAGFVGTENQGDGCGRFEVTLEDVPSLEVGEGVIAEARTVDLDPWLERAGP